MNNLYCNFLYIVHVSDKISASLVLFFFYCHNDFVKAYSCGTLGLVAPVFRYKNGLKCSRLCQLSFLLWVIYFFNLRQDVMQHAIKTFI